MKTLISGIIVFVVWSIFSVWLYIDKLSPVMDNQITVQPTSEIPNTVTETDITVESEIQTEALIETDSVRQPEASIPKDVTIYFEFDDVSVNNDSIMDNNIIKFKEFIDKNSEYTLLITGYSDNKGTLKYNQVLGLERAKAVQHYVESKGVDAAKIIANSEGENKPINDQSSEDDKAKNRRVVITIKN